jgi:hypothetical protein
MRCLPPRVADTFSDGTRISPKYWSRLLLRMRSWSEARTLFS